MRSMSLWTVLLLIAMATAFGVAVATSSPLVALLVPALLGLLCLVFLVRWLIQWPEDPGAHRRVLQWTLATLGSHLVVGLGIANSDTLIPILGGDDTIYNLGAQQIVQHWTGNFPAPVLPPGKEGYYYILAALYLLFGPYKTSGLVLNAVLTAALVPLLSDLTRRLFGAAGARFVPPLICFLPGLFLWTSLLLKEATVLFLIAVAASCAVRLAQRVSFTAMAGLSGSVAVLFTVRGPVAFVIGAGLLFGIFLGAQQSLVGATKAMTALALLATLVLMLGVGYSGYRFMIGSNLERANVVRFDLSTSAGSGFAPDADISTPRNALSHLPVSVVRFAFGPFPWQLEGGRQLLVLPDILIWWGLLPYLWKGQRRAWTLVRRRTAILVFPAAATLILLALVIGNFGTLVRERMQIVVLLIPFIALGLSHRRSRVGAASPRADEKENILYRTGQ